MADPAEIMLQAANEVGWAPPGGDAESIAAWCKRQCARIAGGQDREHAENAVQGALEAAHHGNMEYAVAGLRVAHQATRGGL
jgi:hypothetical protein